MDPLAQLKDIHIPAEVHNYPVAYGWWILLAVIIVLVAICVSALKKHKRKVQAKRAAIKHLSGPITNNDEILTTLKWAATHYFPRDAIAQLYGKELNDFMLKQLPEKYHQKFNQLAEPGLNSRYKVNEKVLDKDLLQAALLWLKHALPANNGQKIGEEMS
ncbi:DUF4381 domain-containing protein [Thalassotalea piscium]|uniref:Cbb3-type cytochrome oxidase subunit 3 n=1 Tax=Thalassotalea piscium TaxID=1230533 RepID=A0A7X0TS75_9GAMM|nr:DUF4381 domain-containing protein [Thalassotalea piscium]MBB6541846.1 cbb3-type cytochrome oxidase subunit 3 [Thalassotalea piscium]